MNLLRDREPRVPSGSYSLRGLLVVEGCDVRVAGPPVERRGKSAARAATLVG
jgi:hypothetical protein